MPELEAIAAPMHGAPTLPLHGSTISKSETRLCHPTLINHVQNSDAEPQTPTVQYVEIFAGVGALSRAAEAHGGEIAMLTEKDPVAQETYAGASRTRISTTTLMTTRTGARSSVSQGPHSGCSPDHRASLSRHPEREDWTTTRAHDSCSRASATQSRIPLMGAAVPQWAGNERVFGFEFPNAPGALNIFLEVIDTGTGRAKLTVSLFHD